MNPKVEGSSITKKFTPKQFNLASGSAVLKIKEVVLLWHQYPAISWWSSFKKAVIELGSNLEFKKYGPLKGP